MCRIIEKSRLSWRPCMTHIPGAVARALRAFLSFFLCGLRCDSGIRAYTAALKDRPVSAAAHCGDPHGTRRGRACRSLLSRALGAHARSLYSSALPARPLRREHDHSAPRRRPELRAAAELRAFAPWRGAPGSRRRWGSRPGRRPGRRSRARPPPCAPPAPPPPQTCAPGFSRASGVVQTLTKEPYESAGPRVG